MLLDWPAPGHRSFLACRTGGHSSDAAAASFAGLAATGGLTFAALAIDPLVVQLAVFVAALVVALLAAAAGRRLAAISVLELIDAPTPADADAALRSRLVECGLMAEHRGDIRHRRAAGRRILDLALHPPPHLPAS